MKIISLLIIITCFFSCKNDIDQRKSKGIISVKRTNISNMNNGDSIVEYINIGGKDLVNQWWIINKNDTIRGNYFKLLKDDSIKLGEISKLQFQLVRPKFGWNSNMFIVMPSDDSKLNDDFSNLSEINLDTIFNLQNDNIPHPEISNLNLNLNHIAQFGIEYQSPGIKRIRGFLVELQKENKKKQINRMYFIESVNVVE